MIVSFRAEEGIGFEVVLFGVFWGFVFHFSFKFSDLYLKDFSTLPSVSGALICKDYFDIYAVRCQAL